MEMWALELSMHAKGRYFDSALPSIRSYGSFECIREIFPLVLLVSSIQHGDLRVIWLHRPCGTSSQTSANATPLPVDSKYTIALGWDLIIVCQQLTRGLSCTLEEFFFTSWPNQWTEISWQKNLPGCLFPLENSVWIYETIKSMVERGHLAQIGRGQGDNGGGGR